MKMRKPEERSENVGRSRTKGGCVRLRQGSSPEEERQEKEEREKEEKEKGRRLRENEREME